jgi:hypothetical protein
MRKPISDRSLLTLQMALVALLAILVGYLFRTSIHDYMQFDSDAYYFFDAASTGELEVGLDESILVTENSLPLTVWGWLYDATRTVGLPADPIWGILLNTFMVILAQLLALQYARKCFDFVARDLLKLTLLMSMNGAFMMFAGIHMRDAFLLLFGVASVIAFHPPDGPFTLVSHLRKLPLLLLLMAGSFLCRTESFVIPLVCYAISGAFALKGSSIITKLALLLAGAISIGALLSLDILALIVENYEAYQQLSSDESQEGSLGYTLIYELPFPLSTFASSTLLLFIKFPFWRSMFFDSYTFYLSLAALQMLFVAPAFISLSLFAAFNFVRIPRPHTYLFAVVFAVLFMTAITSMQVRHFAVVYPFLFILYCARNWLIDARKRPKYQILQYSMCIGAVLLSAIVEFRT